MRRRAINSNNTATLPGFVMGISGGLAWSEFQIPNVSMSSLNYTNNVFLINGTAETPRFFSTNKAKDKFIVVCEYSVYYTRNFRTFTRVFPSNVTLNNRNTGIAYSRDRDRWYLMCTNNIGLNGYKTQIWHSSDGINWVQDWVEDGNGISSPYDYTYATHGSCIHIGENMSSQYIAGAYRSSANGRIYAIHGYAPVEGIASLSTFAASNTLSTDLIGCGRVNNKYLIYYGTYGNYTHYWSASFQWGQGDQYDELYRSMETYGRSGVGCASGFAHFFGNSSNNTVINYNTNGWSPTGSTAVQVSGITNWTEILGNGYLDGKTSNYKYVIYQVSPTDVRLAYAPPGYRDYSYANFTIGTRASISQSATLIGVYQP